MSSSPSWRDTPVEFAGVPAGVAVPDRLITDLLSPHACPDCVPIGYSLHYGPVGHRTICADPRAWSVIVKHADTCPQLWLLRQRADGAM